MQWNIREETTIVRHARQGTSQRVWFCVLADELSLQGGIVIDSTIARSEPLTFQVGAPSKNHQPIMEAWNRAAEKMRLVTHSVLFIPH